MSILCFFLSFPLNMVVSFSFNALFPNWHLVLVVFSSLCFSQFFSGRYNFCFPLFARSIYCTLFLLDFFDFAYGCIWRRQWHPTPVLLPGKSHGQRSLVGYNPWGCEASDTTERLHSHFSLSGIGEEVATHSSVLAWRIPGTGEPGGLLSMGSHRVGHD